MSLSECESAMNIQSKLITQSRFVAEQAADSANRVRIDRNIPCSSLMSKSTEDWTACVNKLASSTKALAPISDLEAITGTDYVDDLVISDPLSLELLKKSQRLQSEAAKLSAPMRAGDCPA